MPEAPPVTTWAAHKAVAYDVRDDQQLAVVVERRIATLWRERGWWRAHRYADWPLMRQADYHELRALVRLARTARRLRKPEQADPITAAHRRGEHNDDERRSDCRLCRRSLNAFVRYGVGLSDEDLARVGSKR